MSGTGGSTTRRLVALCVDANEPLRLAHFWAEALGWELDAGSGDDVGLVPTDDTSFGIVFRPVPEGKAGRNRIHFDLTTTSVDEQQESVSRLVELGGRHIDVGQRAEETHVVLADPEGNELCLT
jgi:predicted enzyme related to lactoylglutathione lyase